MSQGRRGKKGGRTLPQPRRLVRGRCVPGCGLCCAPVVLNYTQLDALGDTRMDPEERRWVLEDLTPMPAKEVAAVWPEIVRKPVAGIVDGQVVMTRYLYRCRNLDPDTKQCRIYDRRPGACRGYPWYDDPPHPAKTIPPQCGYNLDVGREPVPVELTRKPAP